jgi:hypothetical protein
MTDDDLILSEAEVQRLCGGLKRPADQLADLKDQGFYRARLGRITRRVVLERAHYDAVCAGASIAASPTTGARPKLRAVQ